MFHKLTRVGTAVAVTTALLGGSLLLAPAANAATHKVDSDLKSISETIKVGSHKDKLTVKATTTKAVVAYKSGTTSIYAAKTYKVTVKNGKHVLYNKTLPTFKALGSSTELLTHKSFASDKKLVAQLKRDVKRSETASKSYYRTTTTKLNAEFAVLFLGALYIQAVDGYAKENPTATTFAGSGLPLTYDKDGLYYSLSGTPKAYTIKVGAHKPAVSFTLNSASQKVTTSAGWVHYYSKNATF